MIRVVILRLLESYFRHRWLNLLPIILFTILGVFYVMTKPPTFMTGGVLNVKSTTVVSTLTQIQQTGFAWVTPAEATIQELGELGGTTSFILAVIQQTDLAEQLTSDPDGIYELVEDTRAAIWSVPSGDDKVAMFARHEDPEIALQLANATIESFLQWNINSSLIDTNAAEEFLAGLTLEYKTDLDASRREMEEYLVQHPEPVRGQRPAVEELQIDSLQANINLAYQRYTNALDQDESVRLATTQTENGVRQKYQLIDSPQLPTSADTSKMDMIVGVVTFTIIGLIFTIVSVIAGAVLDRSFRFPLDIQQALELPVLAAVPTGELIDYFEEEESIYDSYDEPIEDPSIHPARLIPLVEPPTLIIMPGEVPQAQPIQQERNRHVNQTPHRQERQRSNGVPAYHVGTNPSANRVPDAPLRTRRDRDNTSR